MSTANSSVPLLPERLRAILQELPSPTGYLVALSGGLDSVVLLRAMVAIRPRLDPPLRAMHVHHGLHEDASRWSAHCRRLCRNLDVPLVESQVEVAQAARESLEEVARKARYRAIASLLREGEMLLLAHHADDQAETFMLQLLRGAGVAGLAAMPAARPWEGGWMARPLLEFTRAELLEWGRVEGLDWIEDPSNRDTSIARNYLRHRVMPLLRERWPALATTIGRSAVLCAEAAEILEERAESDLEHVVLSPWKLSLPAIASLSTARQRNLLRHWIRSRDLPVPGKRILDRIQSEVACAGKESSPRISWKGGEVRRYREALYLFPGPLPEIPPGTSLHWSGEQPLELPPGLGRLRFSQGRPPWFPPGGVDVVFRSQGLKCRPAGRQGTRSFRKLCQDLGIPPWLRGLLPLLLVEGRLAAVADYCQCAPFDGTPGIAWERPPWLY